MERFFKDARTAERFGSGPLGVHMQLVANTLFNDGYSRNTIGYHLRIIDHFGYWLRRRGLSTENIKTDHARRYVLERGCIRNGDGGALTQLLAVLRQHKMIPEDPANELMPVERTIAAYTRYLHEERALEESTITYYGAYAKLFLLRRFESRRIDLSGLRPKDVIQFIQDQAAVIRSETIKKVTTALRSFLTYLRYRGETSVDLTAAVPRVANWMPSTIPKGLPPKDAHRVLKSCDRRTVVGRRDYAILLLLARLGLRACEVASMSLDDIDWGAGCLTIQSKGGKRSQLPLPSDVGEAIARYLGARRPHPTRHLFLCMHAPFRPLNKRGAVGDVVRHALVRAGVNLARKGAHQFRHALACEMLRHGASLFEIGGVLRHESVHTTAVYAKVDFSALSSLSQPWPGSVK